MSRLSLRLSLGALLVALTLVGCDDGGLTGPDPLQTAAPEGDAFAALLDDQIDADASEDVADAAAFAASAGEAIQAITGPTVITESGVYAVAQDFSLPAGTAADAIVIEADGVFLDLGTHTLTGPGNKLGRGVVVEGARRVVVRGGTLETFGVGVALSGSVRVAVTGVEVVGGDEFADPPNGIPPQIGVLLVNSRGSRVFGNQTTDTNLGLFVRGPGSMSNYLIGNSATAGAFGLLGICYNPAPDTTDPEGPSGDRVQGNLLNGFGVGIQVSEGSANNLFVENAIYYLDAAWEDANGSNTFLRNLTFQLTG
ncbi:MAG: hypothetical protein R3181_05600 [Rubricoccaceae bacterium]|nr:hypothetical protein [Rubricoccaceae bacterium]